MVVILHEKLTLPQRNPHEGRWKKSVQAPPNGVDIGSSTANRTDCIRTPQILTLVLKQGCFNTHELSLQSLPTCSQLTSARKVSDHTSSPDKLVDTVEFFGVKFGEKRGINRPSGIGDSCVAGGSICPGYWTYGWRLGLEWTWALSQQLIPEEKVLI